MKSSNPVLGRLTSRSAQHATFRSPEVMTSGGWAGSAPYTQTQAPAAERMTIDDVVMRAIAMLAVLGVTGALAWSFRDTLPPMVLWGSLGVGLVLGLVISFKQITNPAVILTYAAVEGVLVGMISGFFEDRFPGIVVQAVAATFGIFFGMAVLYRFKVIRATPTLVKWVTGAVIGVVALMAVNFLVAIIGGGGGLGLRDGGPLAIAFSLVCIAVATMTFILDFKAIENGVAAGVERKYAWYAAFGIVVGLIWLYLEILRLIGYSRD